METEDDRRLAKFYPMEFMKDREFIKYAASLLAADLQIVLCEWLPVKGSVVPSSLEDGEPSDFMANIQLCEALQIVERDVIKDLRVMARLAAQSSGNLHSRLSGRATGQLIESLQVLKTLDQIVADGDMNQIHIRVMKINLESNRDRLRMATRSLDAALLDIAAAAKETAYRRFNPMSALGPLELPDVDRAYRDALAACEAQIRSAIALSQRAGNRPSETSRILWASVLFTRLCNFAVSTARLAPGSSYSHNGIDYHWDNSSVSSLVRSAFECFLLFFYIGIDAVDDDEWSARQNLMYLHDATMRLRVFHAGDDEAVTRIFYEDQRSILVEKLSASVYFSAFPDKRRAHFERGRDLYFLTQDEIISRIGWDAALLRRHYELLSAHVHSLPVSFYNGIKDDRGRGVENDPEKSYLTQSLNLLSTILSKATELYQAQSEPFISAPSP